jgi:DNA-binding transcriptional ArsR family regulator
VAGIVDQLRIEDPVRAAVMLHPTRAAVLERLRTPSSSSEVARALGLPAARVNHHVQRLREARLVRRAGTRRVRNLTENLYQAIARTFVVSDTMLPGGDTRRRFRDDGASRPVRNLVSVGERLAGDAVLLLDEAAAGERDVSTYATSMDLRFADAEARAAFLAELLTAVNELRQKYAAHEGDDPGQRYLAMVACYPRPRV